MVKNLIFAVLAAIATGNSFSAPLDDVKNLPLPPAGSSVPVPIGLDPTKFLAETAAAGQQQSSSLSTTIVGRHRKIAVIGGMLMHEADFVSEDDGLVSSIKSGSVVLKKGKKQSVINVFELNAGNQKKEK